MARVVDILGLSDRRVQQKAERGELPGAIKIDGLWTFDEAKLLAWLDDLERQQCETRKAVAHAGRRSPTHIGEAHRAKKRSGHASKSKASPSVGPSDYGTHYDQAISTLRALGLKRVARG